MLHGVKTCSFSIKKQLFLGYTHNYTVIATVLIYLQYEDRLKKTYIHLQNIEEKQFYFFYFFFLLYNILHNNKYFSTNNVNILIVIRLMPVTWYTHNSRISFVHHEERKTIHVISSWIYFTIISLMYVDCYLILNMDFLVDWAWSLLFQHLGWLLVKLTVGRGNILVSDLLRFSILFTRRRSNYLQRHFLFHR